MEEQPPQPVAKTTRGPTWRADIDGLRAIAVGLVIAYHAFPSVAPAGYVGVDVFFVISGYLITSILRDDMASGRFSLLGFYERRARRIFPALALVLHHLGHVLHRLSRPAQPRRRCIETSIT